MSEIDIGEYMYAEECSNPGKKTKRWLIVSKRSMDTLAQVQWYGA